MRQNSALHEYVLALTLTVLSVPWTDPEERLNLERIDDNSGGRRRGAASWSVPTFTRSWRSARRRGCAIDLDDVTYYVGHETIVPREDGRGMPRWQEVLFAAMGRNAERISDYLELPCDHVVEIGREIEI